MSHSIPEHVFLTLTQCLSLMAELIDDDPSWLLTTPDTKTMEQPGTRLCGEEWPIFLHVMHFLLLQTGDLGMYHHIELGCRILCILNIKWVTMNDWTHAGNFFAINEVIDMKWFIPISDQHSMLMLFIIETKTQLQGMGRDVPLIEYSWSNKF